MQFTGHTSELVRRRRKRDRKTVEELNSKSNEFIAGGCCLFVVCIGGAIGTSRFLKISSLLRTIITTFNFYNYSFGK